MIHLSSTTFLYIHIYIYYNIVCSWKVNFGRWDQRCFVLYFLFEVKIHRARSTRCWRSEGGRDELGSSVPQTKNKGTATGTWAVLVHAWNPSRSVCCSLTSIAPIREFPCRVCLFANFRSHVSMWTSPEPLKGETSAATGETRSVRDKAMIWGRLTKSLRGAEPCFLVSVFFSGYDSKPDRPASNWQVE